MGASVVASKFRRKQFIMRDFIYSLSTITYFTPDNEIVRIIRGFLHLYICRIEKLKQKSFWRHEINISNQIIAQFVY